jgi:hypothetical protein
MREVAIGRALGNSFKGKHTFGKEGTFQKTHEGGQVKDSRRDLILGHFLSLSLSLSLSPRTAIEGFVFHGA